jgi:DNA-directed RNA polymerase sigma subunit (sigma70/sigma32)
MTRLERIKMMREKGMTLKDIGWEFRISRQRVHQILEKDRIDQILKSVEKSKIKT